ncbi:hypothetical protein BJN34_09230 [Cupriavidus necator]|uniref:Uncharacterized protein n=1 Tax=Cupriavidus necator TaxID=106590 RepID=A0A1U9UN14_CUPNE|nr:hypothetical protein [Cupriavidus necator]AQV94072.1 hypothetical protein BJN34_09230 [Cupriavidus necator]
MREQHRIDEAALLRWMQQNVAGFAGPMQIDQFSGGQSNRPIACARPHEQHFALKRHLLRASLYRKHLAADSLPGTNSLKWPKIRQLPSDQ